MSKWRTGPSGGTQTLNPVSPRHVLYHCATPGYSRPTLQTCNALPTYTVSLKHNGFRRTSPACIGSFDSQGGIGDNGGKGGI